MNSGLNLRRSLGTAAGMILMLCSGRLLPAAENPSAPQPPPAKIKVVILDGQNNHNWRATTPVIRSILEDSGRFTVAVATMPPAGDAREDFSLPLDDCKAVVSNYTDFGGLRAPKALLDKLTDWVAGGGGLVAIHAATAGLEHHGEFCRMIGLGWGGPNRGDRLAVDASGRVVRTPKGKGHGTGHGAHGPIDMTVWAADHPIVRGLPRTWRVLHDELWFATRGPAEQLTVLATGYSPRTKQNEPILWTVRYGDGRVFVTLLGHDAKCMQDRGFQATLLRGSQWAATAEVTLPAPKNLPAIPKKPGT